MLYDSLYPLPLLNTLQVLGSILMNITKKIIFIDFILSSWMKDESPFLMT